MRADVFSILSSDQCQTEDKQRGVCEPRDPVAAAVPEKRHQQVSFVKRANVGESLLTAPSTPHYLSTSTLYKCKISVKPHMRIWTHITGALYKQRFLIGPFEPCDMLEHDRKRIETDSTALCLKTALCLETQKLT